MTDIRTRFREADRITAPDLWPDITTRRPGEVPTTPARSRVAMAGLGLALAGLAVFVLARAFLNNPPELGQPVPPTRSPFVPVPKGNGLIAFTRIDPDTVVEGQPPDGALYTVNSDGTGLVRLVDASAHSRSSWSPDGSSIAFEDRATGGISVMKANGTEVKGLTSCDGPGSCTVDGLPAWSPDGRWIAFLGERDRIEGVWKVAASGRDLTSILPNFSPQSGPTWSPDGRQIAISGSFYDADHKVGTHAIHIVDAHSGQVVRSFRPKDRDPSDVAWSPDGNWLAFHVGGPGGRVSESALYLIRPDGTDLQLLTSESCPTNTCSPLHPAWSPDGRQIVFTAGGGELGSDGFSGDLLVIDVETKDVRQLTKGPGLDCCPAWQPVTPE
jgi:Tol biopolymer transport system component